MSFFTLRKLPGQCWPQLPDASVSQVWAAYRALDDTQWLTATEIEARQIGQLNELLDHCHRHVPYYRGVLAAHGIESIQSASDLRRLPLVSRNTWQQQFDEFCADQLPPGTVPFGEDRTSGTSGVPVRVLKTNVFYVWWLAFYLRDLEWSGLRPSGTLASIRSTLESGDDLERLLQGQKMRCWNPVLEPLLESGPLFGMDIRQDPKRQIEWLTEVNPDFLLSHASNLELLAGLLLEEARKFPKLAAVQAISETLSDDARMKIERAFAAPVRNLYSCAEAGYVASPCPQGHGLHVHAENVILEILDDNGQPCRPGEMGRVVLTVLHNFRTPFVRYDIGDYAMLAPQPCPCGRGLPLLKHVEGKARPHFKLGDGRWKHSSELVHIVTAVGGHHQHQVVQRSLDEVIVRVVPSHEWTSEHGRRMVEGVRGFFESPIEVRLEVTPRLELSPSGKLRSLVCEA